MTQTKSPGKPYSTVGKFWKSLLYALPMILILFFFASGGKPDLSNGPRTIALLITLAFFSVIFFLMLYTGRTDRYRAMVFILFSVFMSISFISMMFEARQAMTFNNADLLECKIPFCHLVIPMTIIPAVLTNSIIFPGNIIGGFAAISMMVVLWFVATLVLGRGFCSWGCFYGGWDDGFSRVRKRPVIKKFSPMLRWMPFAVLFLVVLSAAMTLVPTYCDWICPFKTVTEFEKVTSFETLVKTVVFLSLFIGLVIALPILTRKRAQCGLLCPLGAVNSAFNKVNAFELKVDKEKCTECMKCSKECPVEALTPEDVKNGKASFLCVKCGKCVDACSKQAIQLHIKGTPNDKRLTFARNLFLYTSFLFLAVFSSGSYQGGIYYIMKWLHLA